MRERELLWQDQHAQIQRHELAQREQAAQAAERARRGAEQRGRLALQGRLGLGQPRRPIESIDEKRRRKGVVLGRNHQHRVVAGEFAHERVGPLGHAQRRFEVAVVDRQRERAQIDHAGLCGLLAQQCRGELGQLQVKGARTRAAGHHQHAQRFRIEAFIACCACRLLHATL